jgi:hypothetical protein
MAMKAMSRVDANREIRRIFARHRVSTSSLQFMCNGKNLLLTGSLLNDSGQELEQSVVDQVVQELSRTGLRINSELDNWNISEGAVSKKGGKTDEKKEKGGAADMGVIRHKISGTGEKKH